MPYNAGSAGSLRSGFRENPTYFLSFVACWVCDSVFRTNRRSRGEMWLNGQTDTPNYRNPRCACAPRVNYANVATMWRDGYRNQIVTRLHSVTWVCVCSSCCTTMAYAHMYTSVWACFLCCLYNPYMSLFNTLASSKTHSIFVVHCRT